MHTHCVLVKATISFKAGAQGKLVLHSTDWCLCHHECSSNSQNALAIIFAAKKQHTSQYLNYDQINTMQMFSKWKTCLKNGKKKIDNWVRIGVPSVHVCVLYNKNWEKLDLSFGIKPCNDDYITFECNHNLPFKKQSLAACTRCFGASQPALVSKLLIFSLFLKEKLWKTAPKFINVLFTFIEPQTRITKKSNDPLSNQSVLTSQQMI